jgi:hypothetical protein
VAPVRYVNQMALLPRESAQSHMANFRSSGPPPRVTLMARPQWHDGHKLTFTMPGPLMCILESSFSSPGSMVLPRRSLLCNREQARLHCYERRDPDLVLVFNRPCQTVRCAVHAIRPSS